MPGPILPLSNLWGSVPDSVPQKARGISKRSRGLVQKVKRILNDASGGHSDTKHILLCWHERWHGDPVNVRQEAQQKARGKEELTDSLDSEKPRTMIKSRWLCPPSIKSEYNLLPDCGILRQNHHFHCSEERTLKTCPTCAFHLETPRVAVKGAAHESVPC